MRKWTHEEEQAILQTAAANPDHLRKAFQDLSLLIGRSPDAIVTRYYNRLMRPDSVADRYYDGLEKEIQRELEDYENTGS